MDPVLEQQIAPLLAAQLAVIEAYNNLPDDAPQHIQACALFGVRLAGLTDALIYEIDRFRRNRWAWGIASIGVGFGLGVATASIAALYITSQ